MSAWRLLVREIHTHGPVSGSKADENAITRCRSLGLIVHDDHRRWALTPLGTDVAEGRVIRTWWRPGGGRWVATWLRALPRGLRLNP